MKSKTIVWLLVISSALAIAGTRVKHVFSGPRWEYKIVLTGGVSPVRGDTYEVEHYYNPIGAEGWEAVGPVGKPEQDAILFKRQLP